MQVNIPNSRGRYCGRKTAFLRSIYRGFTPVIWPRLIESRSRDLSDDILFHRENVRNLSDKCHEASLNYICIIKQWYQASILWHECIFRYYRMELEEISNIWKFQFCNAISFPWRNTSEFAVKNRDERERVSLTRTRYFNVGDLSSLDL